MPDNILAARDFSSQAEKSPSPSTSEFFVCNLDQLKVSRSIIKFFDELKDEIIIFLDADSRVSCFSSVCPHLAGEIGLADNGTAKMRCRWHGAEFDEQGKSINCKGKLSLRRYSTLVRNGEVYLIYEL